MVDHFLQQNTTYDIIALSSLMENNMDNTLGYLNTTLPVNVCARVTSSMIKTSGNDCTYYLEEATVNPKIAASTCANYDFTDPMSVMSFLNATWYGDAYKTDLITATGITTEEYDALMDGAD